MPIAVLCAAAPPTAQVAKGHTVARAPLATAWDNGRAVREDWVLHPVWQKVRPEHKTVCMPFSNPRRCQFVKNTLIRSDLSKTKRMNSADITKRLNNYKTNVKINLQKSVENAKTFGYNTGALKLRVQVTGVVPQAVSSIPRALFVDFMRKVNCAKK